MANSSVSLTSRSLIDVLDFPRNQAMQRERVEVVEVANMVEVRDQEGIVGSCVLSPV